MKPVYCANCGLALSIKRIGLPRYGRIVDVVEYHECLSEPVELDLGQPSDSIPQFTQQSGKDKFVQNLNKLAQPRPETLDLRDRRPPDQVKSSSAPQSILDQLKFNKEPDNG